jgi:hypothetical protein
MSHKPDSKSDWSSIGTRVSPEQEALLRKKHPNKGEISKVLRALISKYLEGRIIGVRLEQ